MHWSNGPLIKYCACVARAVFMYPYRIFQAWFLEFDVIAYDWAQLMREKREGRIQVRQHHARSDSLAAVSIALFKARELKVRTGSKGGYYRRVVGASWQIINDFVKLKEESQVGISACLVYAWQCADNDFFALIICCIIIWSTPSPTTTGTNCR